MESPIRETEDRSCATSIKETHSSLEETSIPSEEDQSVDYLGTKVSSLQTATPKECIDHLKFLSALAGLQHCIRTKDGLFGINHPGRLFTDDPATDARVEEKRWQVYVSRAVDRFKDWWVSLPKYKEQPTVMSLKRFAMNPLTLDGDLNIGLSKSELPPLDVLMVWHSFMLNPRSYLEDCFRQAKMNLWATGFPWDLISHSISVNDQNRYYYDPGEAARLAWQSRTGKKWDNLDDPLQHVLSCPLCHSKTHVWWTTAHISMLVRGTATGFEKAQGYADKSFTTACSGCNTVLDHDYLSVLQFKVDNIDLIKRHLPLPGTLYNPDGVVKTQAKWRAKWAQLTPNYLFLNIRYDFISYMELRGKECRSIRQLADLIFVYIYRHNRKIKVLDMDSELANSDMFQLNTGSLGRGRGTLRRMLSRYWGNSSIFAMDLVGAVIRQGSFVQRMHKLDWIHSRSLSDLPQLMEKFIAKYDIFWKIIVENPSHMVVPTLDVDLVWHTHQLTPRRYYYYSITTTARNKPIRFIDHNDKIDEGRLSDSFEWTIKQYRKATGGKVYSECFCWYCEATRGKGLTERLSLSSPIGKDLDRLRSEKSDAKDAMEESVSAHISCHNAVKAQGLVWAKTRKNLERIIQNHQKHDKTTEQGRESKKVQNRRRDIFEVFEKDPPVHRDVYINDPGCINMTENGVGNCIGGSCRPSMAAGSCGGSAFTSLCASRGKTHGGGFDYVDYKGGGGVGGGGVGCGGS
ncbi:Protein of unknown function DUF1399 [Penicillium occitanis (nom. inval.)]|nr:Protein of unknown function DUF1399 [Penicillium occitanis (nom. inval.)]PCH07467.1 hypothetical protein PENOC_019170 [Penicillium occitanis (nom. inval.)]